jgi:hypothetical protein
MAMAKGSPERDDYLEQDDEEREDARRTGSLVALAVLALLVIGGIVLVQELRKASRLQDCLMTKSTTCADIADPSTPAGQR